jgi:hypothetical protein
MMTVQSVSATLGVNPPAAPTALTAALQSTSTPPQVRLTWTDNASNETGFVIERSTNGGSFAQVGTAPARNNTGSVTFTDNTVMPASVNVTYTYRVAAVNVAGQTLSAIPAAVVVPAVPAAPQLLTALASKQNNSSDRVVLTWTNVANETGYIIQRSTSSNFATVTSFTVGANVTTFTDTVSRGTPGVTTYYYRIIAINLGGPSVPSNAMSIVTL